MTEENQENAIAGSTHRASKGPTHIYEDGYGRFLAQAKTADCNTRSLQKRANVIGGGAGRVTYVESGFVVR